MTPDEIARDVVGRWVLHSKSADELCDAIASAIRAERERTEKAECERDGAYELAADHETRWRALIRHSAALEAERDRLREALGSLVERNCTYDGPNIVIPIGSHGHAIEAMRVARAALARAKGESDG